MLSTAMDDLWDFNIVSLPDDSSQQPRAADFQAPESRSSCSKTAISAAAKVKETKWSDKCPATQALDY